MAVANLSAVLPAPAHPMANPGFGKRNAPDQAPPTGDDFAHLPRREATIAAFIDRLPEGAAMDAKTLAKVLPGYGQQACGSALRYLREAGHVFIRHVSKVTKTGVRRVTRTFFSRTARSGEWWKRFERGEAPTEDAPELEPETEPEPVPAAAPRASRAYRALASLGRTDPRLTLSAAECAHLEPLAAEWLSRHITTEQLVAAVTAGLPSQIHSPAGFVRKRLESKIPPLPPRPVPAYNDRSAPPSPDTFLSEDPWGDEQDNWSALPPEQVTRRVDILRAAAGIARKART
ncbi:hypothetical protein [Streptomyces griseocarneus]|uniref:hypothetical protein n=1 Tax=Streptomyces griseocarneus TaxID=51201 RepID=UPI00167D991B|nr:hypothetical protein [Streptomyces griseocarneus]MBZ6473190.1 hypothetical protein [Streptomyces griseocarneus]GHG60325.1 hypothetical protein GCM10018779_27570 [Streptomyces griseocarneus]